MELAAARIYRAKWTDKIHEEWMRNLSENRPELDCSKLARTRDLMNKAVPDCIVTGYEDLIESIKLPDLDDRHVLAAAIVAEADAIVTFNLKDFPDNCISKYHIEAIHPDDFINYQFDLDNAKVLTSARRCRSRLKNPTKTAEEYLDTLEAQGLAKTVNLLRPYYAII